jgi:hypothetical protein
MLQTNGVNGVTNFQAGIQRKSLQRLEREMGLEPTTSTWEATRHSNINDL